MLDPIPGAVKWRFPRLVANEAGSLFSEAEVSLGL